MTNAVAFKHWNLHALYFSCICAQRLRMPNNARPTEPRYTCDSLLQNQDPMERGMHNRTIHIGTTGCALLLVKKWYSVCQVRQQWQKSAQELKLTHEVHMRTLSTCAQMAYAYQYQTNSTYEYMCRQYQHPMKRSMATALTFDNVIETMGNTPLVYSKKSDSTCTVRKQSLTSAQE